MIYDAVIVGAGPAGAACALYARQHGLRVVVVEKSKLPRDKVCGEAITSPALACVRELGLDEELARIRQMRVNNITYFGPEGDSVTVPLVRTSADAPSASLICGRLLFDDVLQQAVRERAELIDCCRVVEVITEKGRACGVSAHQGSVDVEIRAKVVVGADGARSLVARAMGIPKYAAFRSIATRTHYRQVLGLQGALEIHFLPEVLPGYVWVYPMRDGLTNVGLNLPLAAALEKRVRPKAALYEAIASPALRERFEFAEEYGGARSEVLPLANAGREVHGEGFLLVGDAAGLIHPCSSVGVANGMLSAKIAAQVLSEVCPGGDTSADNLGKYPYRLWKQLGPSVDMSGRLLGLRTPQAIASLIKSASRRPKNAGWISGVLLGSALPSEDMESFLGYLNFFNR